MQVNEVSGQVVDSAMKVHTTLGPGLLETAYEACLEFELQNRGLKVDRQIDLPIFYEGFRLNTGFRIDLLVEDCVVVELKSVASISPIHMAQILSYVRLSGNPVGLLINFNVLHLKEGIHRFVA